MLYDQESYFEFAHCKISKRAFIDNACLIQNSQCKCIYEGGASMGKNGSIPKESALKEALLPMGYIGSY